MLRCKLNQRGELFPFNQKAHQSNMLETRLSHCHVISCSEGNLICVSNLIFQAYFPRCYIQLSRISAVQWRNTWLLLALRMHASFYTTYFKWVPRVWDGFGSGWKNCCLHVHIQRAVCVSSQSSRGVSAGWWTDVPPARSPLNAGWAPCHLWA